MRCFVSHLINSVFLLELLLSKISYLLTYFTQLLVIIIERQFELLKLNIHLIYLKMWRGISKCICVGLLRSEQDLFANHLRWNLFWVFDGGSTSLSLAFVLIVLQYFLNGILLKTCGSWSIMLRSMVDNLRQRIKRASSLSLLLSWVGILSR